MRAGRRHLYDTKCRELAEHFLDDEGLTDEERKRHADLMAQDIQIAAENYLSDIPHEAR